MRVVEGAGPPDISGWGLARFREEEAIQREGAASCRVYGYTNLVAPAQDRAAQYRRLGNAIARMQLRAGRRAVIGSPS
jgi:hypothetical protein